MDLIEKALDNPDEAKKEELFSLITHK